MSVVIFKWNPGFSSYTMSRFLNHLEKCALANNGDIGMNWSIWDYKQVHKNDTFYMLKVGYGQNGIVARGTVTSEPYAGEDWAWRDRPTQYCDFNYEVMVNPDAYPLLDSQALAQAIPDFDWKGGRSGIVLSQEQAEALENLWDDYMQRQSEYFDKASDHNLFMAASPDLAEDSPYVINLDSDYRGQKLVIEFNAGEIHSKLAIFNYPRILGKFGVKSWRALRRLLRQNYPTTESLQTLCSDLFKYQIEFTTDFYKLSDNEDDDE